VICCVYAVVNDAFNAENVVWYAACMQSLMMHLMQGMLCDMLCAGG